MGFSSPAVFFVFFTLFLDIFSSFFERVLLGLPAKGRLTSCGWRGCWMFFRSDEMSLLPAAFPMRSPQSTSPKILLQTRLPQNQQTPQSAALAGQTGEQGSLPGIGERGARAALAPSPPRLLAKAQKEVCRYVTRCLPGSNPSAGGTSLSIGRFTVTRGHRALRPSHGSQGTRPAGHPVPTVPQPNTTV